MITDLLEPEDDIEIVGSSGDAEEALVAASAERANMIITQDHDLDDDACLSVIIGSAPLTILAIEPTGSAGTSVSLRRRKLSLEDGNGNALAQVVRKALEPL